MNLAYFEDKVSTNETIARFSQPPLLFFEGAGGVLTEWVVLMG
jgi:hypothetical protein